MRRALAWLLVTFVSGGCAGQGTRTGPDEVGEVGEIIAPVTRVGAQGGERYRPNRDDYAVFRSRVRQQFEADATGEEELLLEPNYLPYMLHRMADADGTRQHLVTCRWPDDAMPLPVFIDAPRIGEALQNEFRPVAPAAYVAGVARALDTWEEQLEGWVRFARVPDEADAALVLRIHGEAAPIPEPGFRGMGRTEAMLEACRRQGVSQQEGVLDVAFDVPALDIYIADDAGLLLPRQVEGIALHELGHALGMKRHSPIPVDLMYAAPIDRIYGKAVDPEMGVLTIEDVNSFISLYRLPNGTIFRTVGDPAEPSRKSNAPGRPPDGSPILAMAPHVDAHAGFELRVPQDWTRVVSAHGLFAANGPLWDYDVSLEIFLWPHPTVADYLSRYGPALFRETQLVYRAPVVIDGRNADRIVVESMREATVKDFIFIELGDGRLMIILCESPIATTHLWQRWFVDSLGSLEIWPGPAGRMPAPNR